MSNLIYGEILVGSVNAQVLVKRPEVVEHAGRVLVEAEDFVAHKAVLNDLALDARVVVDFFEVPPDDALKIDNSTKNGQASCNQDQ